MKTNTHKIGLTDSEVSQSRLEHGANILTPPRKVPIWKLLLEKFNDPIIKILIIAAILSLIIGYTNGEYTESIGIFVTIILATCISFWFEYDANKKFDILNQVNDDTLVKCYRNNKITEVAKKDIVVGDHVILGLGDEIPADGTIIESISLQIDESCLTGELVVDKTSNPDFFSTDSTYPSNHLLRGTKVLDGSAEMIVTEVGDKTEYGKTAQKATEINTEPSPLSKQLSQLAKLIGIIGFTGSILIFIILCIKDIIHGVIVFTPIQLFTSLSLIISLIIASTKFWLPFLYDGFEIITKQVRSLPKFISNKGYTIFAIIGLLSFSLLMLLGYTLGINPLEKSSWIGFKEAAIILQYFMVAVTLIVVSVPEGLPMSVTLSLALSMKRMLKANNLVRKMHATETMGATTVICTDKTGTLTKNQMTVYDTHFFNKSSQGLNLQEYDDILIADSLSINSTAHIDNSKKAVGNPTEAAFLLHLDAQNIDYIAQRESVELIEQISFSTERKYMLSIVESKKLNKKILYIKGAPEILLSLSKTVKYNNDFLPISQVQSEIETLLYDYQSKAMRTIGFAYEIIEDDLPRTQNGNIINSNLVFLGIAAISDPVREDVRNAVNNCRDAGINIIMVTGDTQLTAQEIGKQSGIINNEDHIILTGPEFASKTDDEIIGLLPKLKILCRARPNDKQRLVLLLQKAEQIVAVTGDGTNDAPALNHADVGLSMGSGTSVAKEASDITILDDSFNSITSAVLWGRSLYQNIQKFIVFQLTINITAMVLIFISSILGHDLPLTVTQMLWVNLIMDSFAAAALASLPPNDEVMKHKPRKNKDFIISKSMRNTILLSSTCFIIILLIMLFIFADENGDISTYNLSVFFTSFVMLQFWNLFIVKTLDSNKSAFKLLLKNKAFLLIGAIILVGQIIIVEFGSEVFRTTPIKLIDWLIIIFSTSLIFILNEIKILIKSKIRK